MKIFVVIAMLGAIFALGYYNHKSNEAAEATAIAAKEHVPFQPFVATPKSKITGARAIGSRCDGRTHCSHMTSCAEAKYFIQNCPNTSMDGDKDGVPCEEQWCH